MDTDREVTDRLLAVATFGAWMAVRSIYRPMRRAWLQHAIAKEYAARVAAVEAERERRYAAIGCECRVVVVTPT